MALTGNLDIALIAGSILVHSVIGRSLHVKGLFTQSLTGIAIPAAIIAIFANFYAGACHIIGITSFVLCSLVVCVRAARAPLHSFRLTAQSLRVHLPLLGLIAILMYLLSPQRNLLVHQDSETIFQFNRHYSYYSSQVMEMRFADYAGRLRISNLFPAEWCKYHFFNPAVQMIGISLIPEPGIFSFFAFQQIFTIFAFLSIAEGVSQITDRSMIWPAITVSILGLGLFAPSVGWNLSTSGAFAFFAATQLTLAIILAQWGSMVLFAFLLAISVLRNIPLVGLFAGLFCPVAAMAMRTNPKFNFRLLSKPALISATALVTAGSVYVFISILNAARSPVDASAKMMTTFTSNLSDSFSYLMAGYQWAGVAQRSGLIKLDFPKFNEDWAAVHSTWFLNHLLVGLALVFFAIASTIIFKLSGVFTNFKEFKIRRLLLWIAATVVVLSGYTAINHAEIGRQIIVWSLYFLAIFSILPVIYSNKSGYLKDTMRGQEFVAYAGLTLLLISAITYFLTDFPVPIKVPAVHAVCDGMTMVLLSILVCVGADRSFVTRLSFAGILGILLFLYVTPPAKGFLTIPNSENNFVPINVTPLLDTSSAKQKFLDNDGFLLTDCDLMPLPGGSADQSKLCIDYQDAYSAILGARMHFSEKNRQMMNYNFINQTL